MLKNNRTRYILTIRGVGEPKICLPMYTNTSNWIEITTIGDEWAKFLDPENGCIYDCALFYEASMKELLGDL